jgi:hypothetical protein
MKSFVTLFLFLMLTVQAALDWQDKIIGNLRIEVPTDCQVNVQNTSGLGGAVQRMKKYSLRNRTLDLELVFLSYLPGTKGNLDAAAANMSSQFKAVLGEASLTSWKVMSVSRRPARHIATKPSRRREVRQAILIDDLSANNQVVIVDVAYDSRSPSAKDDCERIMKSVRLR